MLIYPMNAFPWVVNGVIEARVSALRIAGVLASADGTYIQGGGPDVYASFAEGRDDDMSAASTSVRGSYSEGDGEKVNAHWIQWRTSVVPSSGSNGASMPSTRLGVSVPSRLSLVASKAVWCWQAAPRLASKVRRRGIFLKTQRGSSDSEGSEGGEEFEGGPEAEKTSLLSSVSTGREGKGGTAGRGGEDSSSRGCRAFVLGPISFQVHPGQLFGVVGRVGAGKSTLLLGCLGEARLVSGDCTWPAEDSLGGGAYISSSVGSAASDRKPRARRGQDAEDATAGSRVPQLRAAYCTQQPAVHSGSVRDNILMGLPYNPSRSAVYSF